MTAPEQPRTCDNLKAHPGHPTADGPACPGRKYDFCEPCALGRLCPFHSRNFTLRPYRIAQLPQTPDPENY